MEVKKDLLKSLFAVFLNYNLGRTSVLEIISLNQFLRAIISRTENPQIGNT